MSAVQERTVLWHRDNVSIGDVLNALDGLRSQFAHEESEHGEHPHPRNCVMTMISVAPDESHEEKARRTTVMISQEHPSQAIVIREKPPAHGRLVDAWITRDGQRPKACGFECEFVTLHVYGAASDHLAPLLDPLLVSGVPTYLWWLGTPPFGRREILDALKVCDGLVVDSAQFDEPFHSFHRMASMLKVAHHRMGLADLQWARLRAWRESVAQFFTPYDRREFLGGISELAIEYAGEGRGNRIGAGLLTGWIASTLGWKLRRVTATKDGAVDAGYDAGGRPVQVSFRSAPPADRVAGELSSVRLAGAGRGVNFRLSVQHNPPRAATAHPGSNAAERRRGDTARVLMTMIEIGEGQPLRHIQQLEPEDEAALMLDVLSTGTHDEVFNRSLAAAVHLMDRF